MQHELPATAALLGRLATRLFAHRWPLFTLAFAMTVLAIAPPLAVAHFGVTPPRNFWSVFFISAPLALWSWALLLVPVWFHPRLGTLGEHNPTYVRLSPSLRRGLRAWAIVSLLAFLLAPGIVSLAR